MPPHTSATLRTACLGVLLAFWISPAAGQCPDPVGATCPHGFYMAELALQPSTPIAGRPFVVTASGGTGSTPVNLTVGQVTVDGSRVRIESWIDLGPWATPGAWSEPFLIPALDPGDSTLELWIWDDASEQMVLNSVTALHVQAAGVPAMRRMGLLVLAGLIAGAGIILVRRLHV